MLDILSILIAFYLATYSNGSTIFKIAIGTFTIITILITIYTIQIFYVQRKKYSSKIADTASFIVDIFSIFIWLNISHVHLSLSMTIIWYIAYIIALLANFFGLFVLVYGITYWIEIKLKKSS